MNKVIAAAILYALCISLTGGAEKRQLIPRQYHFAAWSLAVGAIPYAGHGTMVIVSGAGIVSTVKKPGPQGHKLAMYPFWLAAMGINGYAFYLCTQDNDNYVPAMLLGSLGSGLTLTAGTWVYGKLSGDKVVGTDKPPRWALYPALSASGYGLALFRTL